MAQVRTLLEWLDKNAPSGVHCILSVDRFDTTRFDTSDACEQLRQDLFIGTTREHVGARVVLTHGCSIMRQRFDQHKAQRVAIIQEGIRAHGSTNMAVPVGVIENVDAQSLPNGKQAQMELFRNRARRRRSQQGPPIRGVPAGAGLVACIFYYFYFNFAGDEGEGRGWNLRERSERMDLVADAPGCVYGTV
mgnify:CR=1 FL=1